MGHEDHLVYPEMRREIKNLLDKQTPIELKFFPDSNFTYKGSSNGSRRSSKEHQTGRMKTDKRGSRR